MDALKGDKNQRNKVQKMRNKRRDLTRAGGKQLTLRKNLSNYAAQLDCALARLESRRKYRCVFIRNQYIKKRIRTDFGRRQRKLARLAEHHKEKYDGSIEVFPVCATAFRDLLKRKKPMPGFPSKLYTGIPRLRRWLDEAVLPYRKDHLDSMLRRLQRLYDGIKCWSDGDSRGMVYFSQLEIETSLKGSHSKYQDRIQAALTRAADDIKQLSPFQHKDEKLASCRSKAVQATSRWPYKFPDDLNSTKKMAWVTFQAILARRGGPFQSTGAGRPCLHVPAARMQATGADSPLNHAMLAKITMMSSTNSTRRCELMTIVRID
ncbi:uncharacterized protein B0T15DRAFT_279212 [Chaetomium strumarium]|uniref:Uncharacterized protein n=1 Tax=Chaetomium strumarium TaxID=1170767 RepID=A0AAJ0GP28_9PEZI|nr:hypothetical protein B0T15DRAFT_279212 [Chaetomium strumarium]